MNHRRYVGSEDKYDLIGALQFNNLISSGLREYHKLLDIGCGSLRAGRFFIMYLKEGHYFGLEPNNWLVEAGIKNETGSELIEIKRPKFNTNINFCLSIFNTKFDYLLAQSIFTHTPKHHIIKCCEKAYEVMHDKSIFLATFFLGSIDYIGTEWYEGAVYYTYNTMKEIINSTGLNCEIVSEWHHPNGQTWLKITKK